MPHRCTSLLTALALGSTSVAALAQPASAPVAKAAAPMPVSPLTVQAAPEPKAVEAQARSFVQNYAVAPNPQIDQISRWHDPVCIQITGLPLADQAAKIKARIESVAQAQGLPAAPAGCRANVEIVFTDQPQSAIDAVAKNNELLLGYYHHERFNQIKTVTHPIQAWYVTATRGDGSNTGSLGFNGTQTMADTGSGAMGFGGTPVSRVQRNAEAVDDPQGAPPVGCVDRFKTCYSSVLYNVLIVADNKALAGKDMGVVADDLVMLALSQARSLDGCNAMTSVIEALAKSACTGRDPPTGLTAADSAYLSALYASDSDAKKAVELSDIASRMAKILIKGNTVAAAGAGSTGPTPADAKAR